MVLGPWNFQVELVPCHAIAVPAADQYSHSLAVGSFPPFQNRDDRKITSGNIRLASDLPPLESPKYGSHSIIHLPCTLLGCGLTSLVHSDPVCCWTSIHQGRPSFRALPMELLSLRGCEDTWASKGPGSNMAVGSQATFWTST